MFTVEQVGPNLYRIVLDTDEVRLTVGEIMQGRRWGWEFHHLPGGSCLKPNTKKQLTEFGCQQVELRQITARLME